MNLTGRAARCTVKTIAGKQCILDSGHKGNCRFPIINITEEMKAASSGLEIKGIVPKEKKL